MKVTKIDNFKITKKKSTILIALGLATILSSCNNKIKKQPYIKPELQNDSYKIINNGYKMKILTTENHGNIDNYIGYFDINEDIEFLDINTNSTLNLTLLTQDESNNIYVSDITKYIDINEYVNPKLSKEEITSLNEKLEGSTLQINKSEYSIDYKLLINNDDIQKSVNLTNITENLRKYKNNTENREIMERISFGK